jgi:hypothetical protein
MQLPGHIYSRERNICCFCNISHNVLKSMCPIVRPKPEDQRIIMTKFDGTCMECKLREIQRIYSARVTSSNCKAGYV